MTTSRKTRSTALAAAGAAVLLALTATAPALAGASAAAKSTAANPSAAKASAPYAEGSPSSVTGRVARFYGAYIDGFYGTEPDPHNPADALRAYYLTPALQARLKAWEAKNHADGVLRAQDIPNSWSATSDGSGAGHTWVIIKLTWGGGVVTKLHVQADLQSRKISDIKPMK